jgi:integrase
MTKVKQEPVRLTKAFIDRVAVPTEGYVIRWDATVKGYGLRVSSEGKKTFIVLGRVQGKLIQFTIGAYGTYTEDAARKRAQKVLQDMREGIDPRDAKKHDEAVKVTLADVSRAYVARPGKLKPSTIATIERHVRTTFASMAEKPIASITEDQCKKLYRKMLTGGLHGKKGAPGQANQGFAVLGALINYASRQYKRSDGSPIVVLNPVAVLKDDRVRLKARTTRIPDNKVGAVWNMLNKLRDDSHNRETIASIDLVSWLLMTGCRLSEGNSLKWEQVNLDERQWHLPDPKNSHEVFLPLSTQAVALLKRRRAETNGDFVFPSWSKAGHIMDPRDVMKKVSEAAGVRLTNHDLRRTMTNISLRCCRIEKFRTDLLTNHMTRDVTAEHYFDTTNLQWLEPEVQKIADWIELEATKASGANVVVLAQRA